MLDVLLVEHKAGWSSIVDKDFNLPCGFIDYIKEDRTIPKKPMCYCHGEKGEKPTLITHKNASAIGCEWCYAFDMPKRTMYIMASYNPGGTKMLSGAWGLGNPEAVWRIVKIVKLDGKEPDWSRIKNDANNSKTLRGAGRVLQ